MAEFIMEFDEAIYDKKTGMSVFKPRAVGELIRCKDCKHWERTWANSWSPNYHYCPMIDRGCPSDFYCADAEVREDG